MKQHHLFQIVASIAFASLANAAPMTFDFKDPKGVNNIVFKTDAPLESINGTATGISGSITFDPDKPAELKGAIVVAANSLHVGNPMMKEHLHGDKWLDVAKFPEIKFEAQKVSNVTGTGNSTSVEIQGPITIHGVIKEITVPVQLTYLKDRLKDRLPGQNGDLLVLRSKFTVKRSDFGINKGQFEDKVSDDIDLTLSIAGAARH